MKLPVYIIIGLNVIVLIGLITYVTIFLRPQKTAFFYNQKVFEQFTGKADLQKKLEAVIQKDKAMLDSLTHQIEMGNMNAKLILQEKLEQAEVTRQQLSEQYTGDIWKYINGEVLVYGKEKGYDYIFGASGNGSLMYAGDAHDITQEMVDYLNAKYK
jgi:outer membrane protein